MKKKIVINKQILGWILVIIGMIAVIFVRGIITHTNVFLLDNWYSTANDEVNYYRSVQIMRTYGLPQGYAGYNEQVANLPSFGSYNYFTYVVYYLLSFVTGISSHNFIIHANVILMTMSYVILIILIRPTFSQSLFIFLFQISQLTIGWYTWSGMSEANTMFMMVVTITIVLYLHRRIENMKKIDVKYVVAFLLLFFLISFYGAIRPFLWVFILYPIWYLWITRKKGIIKTIYMLILGGVSLICLLIFMISRHWMGVNVSSKYFTTYGIKNEFFANLKMGNIGSAILLLLNRNISETKIWMEAFAEGQWVGIVTVETMLVLIFLLVFAIVHLYRKEKDRGIMLFIFVICALAIMEANILLYTAGQFHRMLLTSLIGGVLLLILEDAGRQERKLVYKGIHQVCIICLFAYAILRNGTTGYVIPSYNPDSDVLYECDALQSELQKAIPYGEDKWDNTIAAEPLFDNFQLVYCRPLYVMGNGCTHEFLMDAVTNHTLKSKYVLVSLGEDDLISVLETWGFPIWENYGYRIYKKMK